MKGSSFAMKLCLISDDPDVEAAVRQSCPRPHTVEVSPWKGLLTEAHLLSEQGRQVVTRATEADAVLVDWSLERAPWVGTLCFELRRRAGHQKTFAPVVALCGGGVENQIAALASGADDSTNYPLQIPMLQARIAAHHRLAEAIRRATAARLKKRLASSKTDLARVVLSRSGESPPTGNERTDSEAAAGPHHGDWAQVLSQNMADQLIEDLHDELALHEARHDVVRVGDLRLDRTSYRFYIRDEEVDLMPREFALLSYLMDRPDEACTRDQILDAVWGIDFDTGTNMVDVYMHFLRKKLEAHGITNMIQTIRGRGYRLAGRPAPSV